MLDAGWTYVKYHSSIMHTNIKAASYIFIRPKIQHNKQSIGPTVHQCTLHSIASWWNCSEQLILVYLQIAWGIFNSNYQVYRLSSEHVNIWPDKVCMTRYGQVCRPGMYDTCFNLFASCLYIAHSMQSSAYNFMCHFFFNFLVFHYY
jgi:hypothetical protein